MKIDNHNLDSELLAALQADLKAVERAPARRRPMPRNYVYIVALELGNCPSDLPKHKLKTPSSAPPIKFKERCEWELQRQSFQLIRDGQAIWIIAGGREGALYGFDELLECMTGVVWAGVRDDQLIFAGPRKLPEGVQTPSFPYRFRDGSGPDGATEADYHVWLSRNRFNGRVISGAAWDKFPRQRKDSFISTFKARAMHLVSGYHAMEHYLTADDLAAHPEWMGLRDGERVATMKTILPEAPHLNDEVPVQPCYTNPGVIRTITERMAAQVKQNPEIEIFSIWPYDGVNNWCQCPNCSKVTPFEQLYHIALELTKLTPATLPLELIIYANTLTPPRKKLPKCSRIVANLCPYLRPYERRFYEIGGQHLQMSTLYPAPDRINPVDDRDYGKLFRLWAPILKEAGVVTGIFDYGAILWHDETFRTERQRFLYHPSIELRFDEANWYRKNGVSYIYYCSSFVNWPDAAHQLALGRSLWDAELGGDAFLDHYYSAAADSLGGAVRQALAAIDAKLVALENPKAELSRFERILDWLPRSSNRERYQSWVGYVRLAWQEVEAALAERYTEALEHEITVAGYLQNTLFSLVDAADTRAIMRYSEVRQQRLKYLAEQAAANQPEE